MLLIVGLGNPEKKYDGTRHNIGFRIIDALAKEIEVDFKTSEKFNAEIAESTLVFDCEKKHVRVILAKPNTYMNNSGEAVAKLVSFYKIRTEDQVFVAHDDLDIDLGMIRIRVSGSSAGQKGIQSIIDKLGTDKFVRFRIGIKPKSDSTSNVSSRQLKPAEVFVLEKFSPEEKKIIEVEVKQATDLILESIDNGVMQTSI